MNLIEKATIRHYHNHRIAAYQNGSIGALGWRTKASQVKRFEVLATVGDMSGCAVLDIGCGYGDLKGFLDRIYSDFTYIGIDQMPQFIAEAKNRYRNIPNTHFFQTDFSRVEFPEVDHVVASGALGYRCQDPDYHFDMIGKMYAAATRAVAFNMLDSACFPEDELLVGHDFDGVAAFCRQLSHRIQVLRGYLADDFTIYMYKG